MDFVLLGFCLVSLLITSFIVFLDLSRTKVKQLDIPETDLPEFEDSMIMKDKRNEISLDFFDIENPRKKEKQKEDAENPVSDFSGTILDRDFEEKEEEEESFYKEIKVEEPKPDFLRQRIESALVQQLNQLGYLEIVEQMEFIQNVLKEDKESISNLNPAELREVLSRIIELRENSSNHTISKSA